MHLHAVLLDVFGLGVLVVGESGIGKSECALDLIDRGHRPGRRRRGGDQAHRRLAGRVVARPDANHMEIRGVGVLNIKDLYGVSSIGTPKRVELVVGLERWETGASTTAWACATRSYAILGLEVPLIRMPVAPGRNLALLVEVAARNQLLKAAGYDAAAPAGGAGGRGSRGRAAAPAAARAAPCRRAGRAEARGRARAGGGACAAAAAAWRGAASGTARLREPQILIITGLSGSGKTHVARALEDIGWFCVDNLPSALIPRFAELIHGSEELHRSALVVDMRERDFLKQFPHVFRQLKARKGVAVSLLFLEADEKVLLRRFSETRPPPPAGGQPAGHRGHPRGARGAAPIRKMADMILDTSELTVHGLRDYIQGALRRARAGGAAGPGRDVLRYKYGVPSRRTWCSTCASCPTRTSCPA